MPTMQYLTAALQRGKHQERWRRRALLAAVGLAALWMWVGLEGARLGSPAAAVSDNGRSVEGYVRLRRPEFMKGTQARYGAVFVVDPADLGCPPCFEDFEKLLGHLTLLVAPEPDQRLLLLIRQGRARPWGDSVAVRQWADLQGFSAPLLMVPDTVYANFGLQKTGVLVLDTMLRRVLVAEIPMRSKLRAIVLSHMKE